VRSPFQRWAFDPVDTAPIAALRIACGLLVLGWCVSLLPDVGTFLHDGGVTQHSVGGTRGWWTLDAVAEQWAAVIVLVLAAIALTVGWHSRVACVLVAVLLLVIQRRDVYMLNSGDLLLRHLAVYLCLMPTGETWSLDARRRGSSSPRAPWGLRMLQVQVSVIYFFSVVAKLHGDSWQDGTAVGRALQLADLQRIVVPQALSTNITLSALATYGTIVVEGALVFGLWLPRFRWVAMAAGISIHLGIEATLLVGWFSLTIIACYLAFVPPEVLRRVVSAAQARLRPEPEPQPVPVVPAAPTAFPAEGSVASPYAMSGAELAKRLEVRITPRPEEQVAELPDEVRLQPLDPVTHEPVLDPLEEQPAPEPPTAAGAPFTEPVTEPVADPASTPVAAPAAGPVVEPVVHELPPVEREDDEPGAPPGASAPA
jgi:hypothetical protein